MVRIPVVGIAPRRDCPPAGALYVSVGVAVLAAPVAVQREAAVVAGAACHGGAVAAHVVLQVVDEAGGSRPWPPSW